MSVSYFIRSATGEIALELYARSHKGFCGCSILLEKVFGAADAPNRTLVWGLLFGARIYILVDKVFSLSQARHMRVFASNMLTFLLAFQAGGLAPVCIPCGMQTMEMPSCHGRGTEDTDSSGLVAKCCCSMRQVTETSGDYAAIHWVGFSRLGTGDAVVSSLSRSRYLNFSERADAHLPRKLSGSPPALFLLKNSYLI